MKREYNISKEDLYLNYSWDQIQEYLINLPPDRIINLDGSKLSKAERDAKFMEALYDRDTKSVESSFDSYQARVRKLEIKNLLKSDPDNKELIEELQQIKKSLGE